MNPTSMILATLFGFLSLPLSKNILEQIKDGFKSKEQLKKEGVDIDVINELHSRLKV